MLCITCIIKVKLMKTNVYLLFLNQILLENLYNIKYTAI